MIEAENLTKYYGTFLAIEDVSFEVGQGEIVGFLGPNGAGKTTTMRILAGFIPPSSGTARVAGYNIHTQSLKARQRIGYLPETVPLYKDMTVKSFLRFYGTIRGMDKRRREARVKEVMDICRIDGYARTPISKLSKGFRQLVCVAQAILHEPEVLILDEPTIGIDPRQVVQIRQLIKDLGQEHTVILSTHILAEVSMICERIMIMDHGKIVAVDSAERLSERLKGTQKIEIEVKGPAEAIAARLRSVQGVFKVTVGGSGDQRLFEVECSPGQDIREELASAVVESGFSLLELKSYEMSVEDIFLKLTDRQES
ncbi:MAG: ABC transporter ATP-binding protein [Deltaproteobacteria bacterium]|nr:ABC transporter ATP-binding protein [Deltaproteobacteria bacterium]MBW2086447.1 ABC transporter ATP-binding protein [Deltaproteobacteria bacterium]